MQVCAAPPEEVEEERDAEVGHSQVLAEQLGVGVGQARPKGGELRVGHVQHVVLAPHARPHHRLRISPAWRGPRLLPRPQQHRQHASVSGLLGVRRAEPAAKGLGVQILALRLAEAGEARGAGLVGPLQRRVARLPAAQGRQLLQAGAHHELQVEDNVPEHAELRVVVEQLRRGAGHVGGGVEGGRGGAAEAHLDAELAHEAGVARRHRLRLAEAQHHVVRPDPPVAPPKVVEHARPRAGQARVGEEEVLALRREVAHVDPEGLHRPRRRPAVVQRELRAAGGGLSRGISAGRLLAAIRRPIMICLQLGWLWVCRFDSL